MLIGAVVAYNQIRQLDVNEHSISLLDDVLLFICLPAFFIETTFSLVATISILNIVKTIDFIVMVSSLNQFIIGNKNIANFDIRFYFADNNKFM